jgi:hypothetical protein
MTDFESIITNSNNTQLSQFYKNMKILSKVEYNKENYNKNLINILQLFDKFDSSDKKIDYNEHNQHFSLQDYKNIFRDFRNTLKNGRKKDEKVENLLKFHHKTNALKRYYMEFE